MGFLFGKRQFLVNQEILDRKTTTPAVFTKFKIEILLSDDLILNLLCPCCAGLVSERPSQMASFGAENGRRTKQCRP